jgi:hypothetical protein
MAVSFADWVIIITTLVDTVTWPDQTIWRLYQARWQVDVVIKRMKQALNIGQLRCRTLASGMALIWAKRVVWRLHEPALGELRRMLHALAHPHPATLPGQCPDAEAVVSTWGLSRRLLDTLRQAIWGTWTRDRLTQCVPRLRRYLVTHPRSDRVHQLTEIGAWLSGVRRTRAAA